MMPILASDTTAAFLSIAVVFFGVGEVGATIPGIVAIGLYSFAEKRQPWRILGIVLSAISIVAGAAVLVVAFIPTHLELYSWMIISIPMLTGLTGLVLWVREKKV